MAVMVYALYTYHWRAASIRKGGRGPYDDRLGPVRPAYFLTLSSPSSSLAVRSYSDNTLYRPTRFVLAPTITAANTDMGPSSQPPLSPTSSYDLLKVSEFNFRALFSRARYALEMA